MANRGWRKAKVLISVLGGTVLMLASVHQGRAQEPNPVQVAELNDGTKMAAYRALARLSFQAFEKGDLSTSALLGRILEGAWDKGEERGGEEALAKTDPKSFKQIDQAMDQFIHPVVNYVYGMTKTRPDPAKVRAAYEHYLEILKLGN